MQRHRLRYRWPKPPSEVLGTQGLVPIVHARLQSACCVAMHHVANVVKQDRNDQRIAGAGILCKRSALKRVLDLVH
jgi:hypothetical protein